LSAPFYENKRFTEHLTERPAKTTKNRECPKSNRRKTELLMKGPSKKGRKHTELLPKRGKGLI